MKTLKWLVLTLGAALLLAVFVSGSWIFTETAIQATSGPEFCSVCHTMKPFAETYAEDTHGGKNPKGLRADCADCHLPHEGQTRYLLTKVKTGFYDIGVELVSLVWEPDWIGNLARRERYTYDSGCLRCHAVLAQAENQSPAAAYGHAAYFANAGAMYCVGCHARVGHKDLLARLSPKTAGAKASAAGAEAVPEKPK